MDGNMDLNYKNEYEFLDLSGVDLDDNERQILQTYLRSSPSSDILKLPWDAGDNNCIDNPIPDQIPESHKLWPYYGTHGEMMKYEMISSDASAPIIMQATMSQAHLYHPAMAVVYHPGEWQSNLYLSNEITIPTYSAGIAYSSYINPTGNENQEIHPGRENSRKGGRGRGGKREGYNRSNHNDLSTQQGYFPVPCITEQYPTMYCPNSFADHAIIPQQHPAVGQPVFSCVTPQPIYQQPIHAQTHTNYNQYHQSQSNIKYNRQPQSLQPQPNGESLKSVPKSHEKRAQNVHLKSFRQPIDEDNSSQTIMTTVIVKNSNMDSNENNTGNTATSKNNNAINNKVVPVNVKIEHNIVSTRNFKSSIEIEQNSDNNKEFENDTVSHIQTTVLKTLSKPAPKSADVESEIESEVTFPKKSQEVIVGNSVSAEVSNQPTSTWASVLKKRSTDAPLTPVFSKPIALINPMNINSRAISPEEKNESGKLSEQIVLKDIQNKPIKLAQETQEKYSGSPYSRVKSVHVDAIQDYDFNDPLMYRMGEFLMTYQMDKQTVSLLPRGLTNRSNYCYINSILQALLACPPFYNLLRAIPHSTNTPRNSRTPLIDNMVKFVHEFTLLSDAARMPRKDRVHRRNDDTLTDVHCGVPFEPFYVYTMLKNTSSAGVFSIEGRQEDAEEFLSCLLNGISDEMLEVMKMVNNDKSSNNNANMSVHLGEEEWQIMGPKNKGSVTRCTDFGRTPISDIFRGQLRSRVHRANEQPTDYVQPFFTLQLDIEKAESVKSALEILVGKDQLEGMTCSKTKQQIEAWKQVFLEELPIILVLHLKWFDYKLDGCSKILKNVEFPVDLKVDSKFLSPNASKKFAGKQKQYKLFAVTYHDGKEATKGHYVTDAFHVGYGSWVRYDDSSLKGISEISVLNPLLPRVPYLLYYRRYDTIGNNQQNVTRQR